MISYLRISLDYEFGFGQSRDKTDSDLVLGLWRHASTHAQACSSTWSSIGLVPHLSTDWVYINLFSSPFLVFPPYLTWNEYPSFNCHSFAHIFKLAPFKSGSLVVGSALPRFKRGFATSKAVYKSAIVTGAGQGMYVSPKVSLYSITFDYEWYLFHLKWEGDCFASGSWWVWSMH